MQGWMGDTTRSRGPSLGLLCVGQCVERESSISHFQCLPSSQWMGCAGDAPMMSSSREALWTEIVDYDLTKQDLFIVCPWEPSLASDLPGSGSVL